MLNEHITKTVVEHMNVLTNSLASCALVFGFVLLAVVVCPSPASAQSSEYDSVVQAFDAGDYEGALLMLDEILLQDPTDVPALELQAQAFAKQGYTDAAKASYKLAFDLLLTRIDQLDMVDVEEMIASEVDPAPVKSIEPLRRVSTALALISLDYGAEAEFLYYAQLAYRFNTTDPTVLLKLADSYQSFGNYKLAIVVMDYAVNACGEPNGENDIPLAELHHMRGSMLYYIDQFGMAIVEYETAEKMGLATPELYGNWAITFEMLEMWQDALDVWTKLSKMDVPAEDVAKVAEHLLLCKEKIGA